MRDSWRQIQVTVPAALAEDVRLLMQRRAGRAVAVEEEFAKDPPDESVPTGSCRVTAWFPECGRSQAAASALLSDLRMAAGLDVPSLRAVRQTVTGRREWRARERRYQRPIEVGSLVLVPIDAEVPAGTAPESVLRIDAAGAFGSGLHPSTRGALRTLQGLDLTGRTVLDVGTGTGVLAIAAARLGAAAVTAIDLDREAVALARRNARRNRCGPSVRVEPGDLGPAWTEGRDAFDVVVANITADAHQRLLGAYSVVAAGPLLLSGIYRPRIAGLSESLDAAGWTRRETALDEEWATMLCRRPGCSGPEGV
ncbi:MAG: 50S ribosomal protein L11 methyltransferase [Chloroflexi bacterium]|nr:50S ribosomal protein L11 methyltransferase [Chloroflexota bacterium]